MSRVLESLAREKQLLLMRSALGRLRLRLAARQVRASPVMRIGARIASVARLATFFVGARALVSTVRYRTDRARRSP